MTTTATASHRLLPSGSRTGSIRGTHGQARRTALLEAADRVVRRDGPEASMAAIAAEAGVTKPVVYRVFASKSGLYAALVERHAGVLLARLETALRGPGTWADRTRTAVDAYLAFLEERPEIYRFLQRSDESAAQEVRGRVATFVNLIVDAADAGLRADLGFRGSEDVEAPTVWAHSIVGMVMQAGDWWLDTGTRMPRAALVDQLTIMITGGIGASLLDLGRRGRAGE